MRLAHDYLVVASPEHRVRATLDRDAEDFAERMGYTAGRFATRDELLAAGEEEWVRELHGALRELLVPERRTLSVGSGYGEHEVQLAVAGYRIVATDIVEQALADAARLFPELETRRFDVLAPDPDERWDDILVASLDYALDDTELELALRNCRSLLAPGGRVILVHRYRDTPGTWLIDRVLVPAVAVASRVKTRARIVRREHGYRRTGRELLDLTDRSGLRVARVRSAGYGMELTRVDLHRRAPAVYRLLQRADRRLRIFNNATVFELIPVA